jgi:hypothetical protein
MLAGIGARLARRPEPESANNNPLKRNGDVDHFSQASPAHCTAVGLVALLQG